VRWAEPFQNTPFYPVADLLQQGFKWRGAESNEEKLGELERDLDPAGLKTKMMTEADRDGSSRFEASASTPLAKGEP